MVGTRLRWVCELFPAAFVDTFRHFVYLNFAKCCQYSVEDLEKNKTFWFVCGVGVGGGGL